VELCWLVVEKRLFYGMDFDDIARELHFRGGRSTAWRTWQRFLLPPHDPAPHQGLRLAPPANKKLTKAQSDDLMALIVQAPKPEFHGRISTVQLRPHGVPRHSRDPRGIYEPDFGGAHVVLGEQSWSPESGAGPLRLPQPLPVQSQLRAVATQPHGRVDSTPAA